MHKAQRLQLQQECLVAYLPDWRHVGDTRYHLISFPEFAAQDETICIGCKQCVWCASATFRIEPTHGRSRVFAQWIDEEDLVQVWRYPP